MVLGVSLPRGGHIAPFTLVLPLAFCLQILAISQVAAQDYEEPAILLEQTEIDFGPSASTTTIAFSSTLTKDSYQIAAKEPWIRLSKRGGVLEYGVLETVVVEVDRYPLFTGGHEGTIIISTLTGHEASITVVLEKPVSSPLIIPWLELNSPTASSIDHAVEGLLLWRRVTDTAIVSTSVGRHALFTTLRARVPGMKFIPGIKTVGPLGTHSFDNVAGWAQIATAAGLMAETANSTQVLFENETALNTYWWGPATINFDQLAVGLSQLPSNLQYIMFPSVHSRQAWLQQKSANLCSFIDSNINARFVSQHVAHPVWPRDPAWIQNHATLVGLSSNPILPKLYFGCFGSTCFWDYDESLRALEIVSSQGAEDIIFYPGSSRWVIAAEQINALLWGGLK